MVRPSLVCYSGCLCFTFPPLFSLTKISRSLGLSRVCSRINLHPLLAGCEMSLQLPAAAAAAAHTMLVWGAVITRRRFFCAKRSWLMVQTQRQMFPLILLMRLRRRGGPRAGCRSVVRVAVVKLRLVWRRTWRSYCDFCVNAGIVKVEDYELYHICQPSRFPEEIPICPVFLLIYKHFLTSFFHFRYLNLVLALYSVCKPFCFQPDNNTAPPHVLMFLIMTVGQKRCY